MYISCEEYLLWQLYSLYFSMVIRTHFAVTTTTVDSIPAGILMTSAAPGSLAGSL